MRSMEEAEQRLARFANDRHTFISSGANAFECRTNASLDFVVAAHKDLVKRIDPNAQAQKASEAASAAQAAAAQAAAAAELTVAAKPLLDKLDAMESRLKAIESKQGSCCVVS